jgi:hypothetical protein
VSPVKYELGFCIPEGDILHSHRRENLKSYILIADFRPEIRTGYLSASSERSDSPQRRPVANTIRNLNAAKGSEIALTE